MSQTWIDRAVKVLKQVRFGDYSGAQCLDVDGVNWSDARNELLSGVPCPPVDLGFGSPADRVAALRDAFDWLVSGAPLDHWGTGGRKGAEDSEREWNADVEKIRRLIDAYKPRTFWRITDADRTHWRTMDSIGMPDWTNDPERALTFTLKEHADLYACDDPNTVRVVPVVLS